MRRVAAALLCAAPLAGCNAAGEPSGGRTFSDKAVPFTFEIPADFTKAPVDDANTRGDVVAAAGLTKIDVIAVRHPQHALAVFSRGGIAHTVLGREVASELRAVPGQSGWYLECQYTAGERTTILAACDRAVATVASH